MGRPVVLSNGELHVGINRFGLVHDFYFPYVGLENHSAGQHLRHKIGVWVEGTIHWLDGPSWALHFSMDNHSLVGHTTATNEVIGISLEFDDFVDAHISVFLRNIRVVNLWEKVRDVRLFLHQAFVIGDSRSNTDTAQYLPDSNAILHYRGRRAFVVSGLSHNHAPFDQHSIGLFGIEGHEGTYRDADDGELACNAVEHGRVDSTIRFRMELEPHASEEVHYWIAAGTSMREALFVHKQVQDNGLQSRLEQTTKWWHDWLQPTIKAADTLPKQHQESFIKSALIIKSHIDKRGAIIASTDTEMLNYSRDAYGYCWPRDGAYALWPLMRLGYESEPRRFFEFCRRALHPSGYLSHKYQADGAIGSSWHPYVHGTINAPPIQEDETALVLFSFAQFYHLHQDKKMLHEFYDTFVKRMADFLASYIDETTGLPKPSYDLWEEIFLTTTYTTATVYAGLGAAAELAEVMEDSDSAVRWRSAADDIQIAAHKHLYNEDSKYFYKGIIAADGIIQRNPVIDASAFFGAFMFGLFNVESPEAKQSFATIKSRFGVTAERPGIPRYEDDYYCRVSEDTLGNIWFISSLWLGQYALETGDNDYADAVLSWVEAHMQANGMLAEQLSPIDDRPVSVSPLVWSHAEYMATILDSVGKNNGSS